MRYNVWFIRGSHNSALGTCFLFSIDVCHVYLLSTYSVPGPWPCTQHLAMYPLSKDEPLKVGAKGHGKGTSHFQPFPRRLNKKKVEEVSVVSQEPDIPFPFLPLEHPCFPLGDRLLYGEPRQRNCPSGTLPSPGQESPWSRFITKV